MKPGLALLKEWNPHRLAEAADLVSDLAYAVGEQAGQIGESASWTRPRWVSDGADVAFSAVGNAQAEIETLVSELGRLEDALANGATAIGDPRDRALDNESLAKGEGFTVADDGTVTPSVAQLQEAMSVSLLSFAATQASILALVARAAELTGLIKTELDNVDQADTTTADAIGASLTLPAQLAMARVPVDSAGIPLGVGLAGGAAGAQSHGRPNVTPLDWSQITGNLVIGSKINITNAFAEMELKRTPDPVLAAITGNRHVPNSRGLAVGKRVPIIGSLVTLLSAQASVNSDIDAGLSASEAYVSNYIGAGTGIVAGAAAGAFLGSVVPGAGTAIGAGVGVAVTAVGSAFASEAFGQGATKLIQWALK